MYFRKFVLMDAAGDAGAAGGGAGAGAGGDAGAGAGAAGGGAPADWTAGIADEATRSWVTAKGYKDPGALATSAHHLEKLVGAGLDRVVQLPKDNTPEAWSAVYDKLGRPAKAEEYKIPVPEGDKGEFAKTAATWFHEAGLNQAQAEKLAAKWNEHIGGISKISAEAEMAKGAEQAAVLSKEWGAALDQNKAIAKQAVNALGVTGEQIDALQKVMGYDGVMKFFHNIGTKVGEADFVGGGGNQTGSGVMTPTQAQAEIQQLRKDPDFVAQYTKGNVEARERMSRLHKMAFPD